MKSTNLFPHVQMVTSHFATTESQTTSFQWQFDLGIMCSQLFETYIK